MRHFRPIAVDKTEVTICCIAPKGEAPHSRAHRIRQYEDFFNASGWRRPTISRNSVPASCLISVVRRTATTCRALRQCGALERHVARCDALDTRNRCGNAGDRRKSHRYKTVDEQIEAEIRRSLFPTLWCCRAELPAMIERNSGVIVNVSSGATRGINCVPYAAAKGGVNALTASLAFERASHGIRVCAVAPGGTDAPPRKIPRNGAEPTEQEKARYRQIVDQTVESSRSNDTARSTSRMRLS
jgi:NAD(P)-dependent dehydrogenase (short-subunit alcohol dehydrogenase family)